MAQVLDNYDFSTMSQKPASQKRFYPWSDWLDGQIWRLTPGEDFSNASSMMERVIRGAALRNHLSVSIRHEDDGCIVFQAFPKG